MIKVLNDERYNEKIEKLIERAYRISRKDACIAVLDDKVFTYLMYSDDENVLIDNCKKQMSDALNCMPDSQYVVDDYEDKLTAMVVLNNGLIITMLDDDEIKWKDRVPEEEFHEYFVYRQMGLDACKRGDIIALFIPELDNIQTNKK